MEIRLLLLTDTCEECKYTVKVLVANKASKKHHRGNTEDAAANSQRGPTEFRSGSTEQCHASLRSRALARHLLDIGIDPAGHAFVAGGLEREFGNGLDLDEAVRPPLGHLVEGTKDVERAAL